MPNPMSDFLRGLSPEQLDMWVTQGSMAPRMKMLNEQMQQAQKMPDTNNHSTGLGGILGGIAGGLNTYHSGKEQKNLQGQQTGLINQSDAATKSYMQALIQALRQGGGSGGQSPVGDFNIGGMSDGGSYG